MHKKQEVEELYYEVREEELEPQISLIARLTRIRGSLMVSVYPRVSWSAFFQPHFPTVTRLPCVPDQSMSGCFQSFSPLRSYNVPDQKQQSSGPDQAWIWSKTKLHPDSLKATLRRN